ncbi:MAG: tetratricopeptide repeat protein [Saprospiraceae bacterium]|nr:tetratricopeptide repeat protein [Saprospiraceae bacterium]
MKKAFILLGVFYVQFATAQTKSDGMTAMQLEEWDKAIKIYEALTKADPTDQDAILTLGNAYLAKGDKTKAAQLFQAAFDAKSDGPLAFVALARVALLKDDIKTADDNLKRAFTRGKKDMTVLRQRGESYFFYLAPGSKKPNLTRAEELLKEAVDVNGKDFATLMSLAYCYKEMPNGGLAAQNYEYAENVEQKNPLPKLMLAKVYKAAKVPEKPLMYFDKAIAVQPSFSPALRGKAEYLYFARKWEEATKAYKDLVKNATEVLIEDEMQLANCLYITKDCVGCAELVAKILAKDGTKNYLRRLLAYCDYENGNYQRGLEILDEYFKIVSPDKILPSDYEYHGNLLIKMKGDTARAIQDFRTTITMDTTGSHWPLYKDIADLQYARKDQCGSAESYKMYLDSLPATDANYATYLYKLGLSQYYCKSDSLRFEKALATFIKITEMRPTATIGWLWSGKAASTQDPSPEAIAADPTLANEYGKARGYYEKYAEIASADKVKNKKDLLTAYYYLAYCSFVKKEEAPFNDAVEKYMGLETDPEKLKTIQEMKDAYGKEEPVDPNAPKPTNGGGKN